MWETMLNMSAWAESRRNRNEADIQKDIERTKEDAGKAVDAAWLDRRAYCLANLLLHLEKEIPVLELNIGSLRQLTGTDVASTAEFIMNVAFVTDRLNSYKKSFEEGNKELEEIKEKLKEYRFTQDKAEYDLELEAIRVKATRAEEKRLKDADKPEEDLKL